jgi:enamine deaminase RidA (YjgF/YER057c/UK114 family)
MRLAGLVVSTSRSCFAAFRKDYPMGKIEERLHALGIVLPQPVRAQKGVLLPFPTVNIRGDRAYVSGHGPLNEDGSLSGPFGKVGAEVSLAQARICARKTGLAIIASLARELGSLDRIQGWCRVFGMVNAAANFDSHPEVINGFSELILDVFGTDTGAHARSAVGMASLPFGICVEIEAEVIISRS